MTTRRDIVDFILDQLAPLEGVRGKRMFGAYGIYVEDTFVALIADDQLFVKATVDGRVYFPEFVDAKPFAQAKPWLLVGADRWDDGQWLRGLLSVTVKEVQAAPGAKRAPRIRPGNA